jgi:hypothetical protein
MPPSSYLSSDLQNIPVALSLLHEKEYNNLCILLKKDQAGKRKACSEKNTQKQHVYRHMSVTSKG